MGIRDQDEQDEHVSAPWKTILDLVMESGVTWGKQKNLYFVATKSLNS